MVFSSGSSDGGGGGPSEAVPPALLADGVARLRGPILADTGAGPVVELGDVLAGVMDQGVPDFEEEGGTYSPMFSPPHPEPVAEGVGQLAPAQPHPEPVAEGVGQ